MYRIAGVEWSPLKLRELRQQAGLTQGQLAQYIGQPDVDKIRRWEHGDQVPGGAYILKLLLVLHAVPEDLLLRAYRTED